MPYSHHSHSGQFCKHAVGLLEDVVQTAISKRFHVYGLTEHVPRYRSADLYPEEDGLTPQDLSTTFDAFIAEASRLRTTYADRISLLVGLETEYITPADLDALELLLTHHRPRIDYIVGSVHHVHGFSFDFDAPTYEAALRSFTATSDDPASTLRPFLNAYFDAQHDIITRFQPEIIGHLDLCRLFRPAHRLDRWPDVWAKVDRNVRAAIAYGALFEFNAAAFRKPGWETAYPGRDVVQLILGHGGKFALSDDSHGPHAVGLHYDKLYAYLRDLGISEIWYLERCERPNAAGRLACAKRAEGDWWQDPFWAPMASSNALDS
ncbi:hypothetical protein BOTBODRAFT_189161 [Botryobasidium botryosum FD-172 SS1]|uniref:Histidinol-phosphatase n=1 Tax=Botryobasidium botryosum (strain FD-172 SS1) TaxID=930990 RepID=A0A067MA45_BOTB1|nr:hypothetical protein BOTBODRAFT_189161 [Botryobasidium botryosum FD-172 SS1]